MQNDREIKSQRPKACNGLPDHLPSYLGTWTLTLRVQVPTYKASTQKPVITILITETLLPIILTVAGARESKQRSPSSHTVYRRLGLPPSVVKPRGPMCGPFIWWNIPVSSNTFNPTNKTEKGKGPILRSHTSNLRPPTVLYYTLLCSTITHEQIACNSISHPKPTPKVGSHTLNLGLKSTSGQSYQL